MSALLAPYLNLKGMSNGFLGWKRSICLTFYRPPVLLYSKSYLIPISSLLFEFQIWGYTYSKLISSFKFFFKIISYQLRKTIPSWKFLLDMVNWLSIVFWRKKSLKVFFFNLGFEMPLSSPYLMLASEQQDSLFFQRVTMKYDNWIW